MAKQEAETLRAMAAAGRGTVGVAARGRRVDQEIHVQHLHPIPEEEMVVTFLQAELASPRFEPSIVALMERDGRDRTIIDNPDLTEPGDNRYRAQVLAEHRGYGRDDDVFEGVPPDVRWYRARATKAELAQVRYIDYDYWTELSGGSAWPWMRRNGSNKASWPFASATGRTGTSPMHSKRVRPFLS